MPKTDVLIAGSGSAGIFAATWLAIYNIPFTILERRSGPLEIGQADGVQVRTVEIYESFGLSEELLREAYHILEVCFWGVDEDGGGNAQGGIKRKSRSIDTERGLSHLPHVILNQARMNGLMLGKMERVLKEKGKWKEGTSNGIEYGWAVKSVDIDQSRKNDPNAHCVKVTAEKDGKEEVWEAKYVLGCDGAHSTIRKALDIQMLGDTSDTVWGVMDIYPLTSFPDIRRKCTIHSAAGNLLIIPREGGQLVRFYIQLPAGVHPKEVKLVDLQDQARRIFAPYTMDFADVFWWSAYSIGQRLASAFHAHDRVFLTGDACHTHSPKAGQGMNVSLQDGYNIGWKLGSVLSGLSPPSLLSTYVSERSKTAADLIAFDKELAKMFSRKEQYEEHIDSVIEPVLVLSSKFLQTEQDRIPDYFWPKSGKWGIRDLHKTYVDDEHYNSGHGHAYKNYGVNPDVGAVVVVRPDQYVSKVSTLDDFDGIATFFAGCLIEKEPMASTSAIAKL
ncbi:uncharacterized protein ALTATR162_LOCUS9514 [Alternaria atra]|uniref:FAD-binding domain-containing protein n=1 Tax=Alternaria atra TaxID=119953 RepID=A0A8J2I742_9PLEO|nr:uncharacterized protein ALTATR162_LOCUS9514 [Alternaria atra]CAG5180942.1 unnamed protein product [Alternaria atra]